MVLVSTRCLLFALAVALLYFIVPKKLQWTVLLAANVFFYCTHGAFYLIYLVSAGILSFFAALLLEKAAASAGKAQEAGKDRGEVQKTLLKKKKLITAAAVAGILGTWIVIKYGAFLLGNINALLRLSGSVTEIGIPELILPLGMSFYTFHAIGYIVDVYRKKYPAERSFLKFFTFLSFFPHMIEGPFSRYDLLGKSLKEEHSFSADRLYEGCARILFGVFKKVVIADPLASTVTMILGDYENYGGVHIIFALLVYSIRLYADFSGYMDMVCGFCRILGIELAENFRMPYFARTVDEYWRRWHITLGRWFRDYVFYPVSMGKTGVKLSKWARKKWGPKAAKLISGYFALIFVWTATGLWHGANWTFLVWGYLNLLVIVSTMQLGDLYEHVKNRLHINSEGKLWKGFCMLRTFLLVSFFRFFSISASVGVAFSTIGHCFKDLRIGALANPSGFFVGMYREELIICGAGVIFLIITDVLRETGKWEKVKGRMPFAGRAFIYALMMLMIMMMTRGSDVSKGFIYANF
ncbi:MAG: MBOAT family protein [Lachnospiraceae bacterium]|nr:MBOAT family protein [Lachnospiraceae bacterium]